MSNDIEKAFGGRLRKVREAAGLTAEKLGEKSGQAPTAISHWERGTRAPGLHNIRALCLALKVSADHLLGLPAHGSVKAKAAPTALQDAPVKPPLADLKAKVEAIVHPPPPAPAPPPPVDDQGDETPPERIIEYDTTVPADQVDQRQQKGRRR